MKQRYLEVTYRKGKPIAAYLYLPRDIGAVLGIELTAPGVVTAEQLNDVLTRLGQSPLQSAEWAPLEAA